MKKFTHFLWWCAGARIDVLEKCPSDHAKYFGIGGTILFTALMACFAGGYAFFTAFKSIPFSIFFGIFWGGLIFNLDRYIVSTIKDDGKSSISKIEWISASPRLLMAILLGFVIATPLELKIFDTEIKTVVERLKIEEKEKLIGQDSSFNNEFNELEKRRDKIENDLKELTNNKSHLTENAGAFYEERKKEIQIDVEHKQKELNAVQAQVNGLHTLYINAINDSLSSSEIAKRKSNRDFQISIRNNIRQEKKELDDRIIELTENRGEAIIKEEQNIDGQISQLMSEKEILLDKIDQMGKTRDSKRTNYDNKVQNYDGFAAHIEAMSTLTKEKSSIFWAKWLITCLFIFIEIAPVLFKLMTESGDYDKIIAKERHFTEVEQKQQISNLNDKINTDIKISTDKNKARLDAELKGNKKLLESIAIAQADIATKAVTKWKDKELKKLEKSLSHIIQSNSKDDFEIINKFWTKTQNGVETTYCFKNGKSNNLLFQEDSNIKVGKWLMVGHNRIETELENNKKRYEISELNETQLTLTEIGSNNKLILNST
ncbi:uncharacterized protein DUF4407 [Flavobacteriaceae bacterium MAR_2010_105]|nr:uncharacterized protein DUF4407 [Flavobacteriaceae bacterium MAR_2010_105]